MFIVQILLNRMKLNRKQDLQQGAIPYLTLEIESKSLSTNELNCYTRTLQYASSSHTSRTMPLEEFVADCLEEFY